MERILNCILSYDRISPDTPLFGGMQGEHRATALVMTPDEAFLTEIEGRIEAGYQVFCRTDIHTPSGECIKGEEREIAQISQPFWLTSRMTSSGLEVTAVFHLMLRRENTESEVYKAQFPLYFEPSALNCEFGQSENMGADRIEEKTKDAVKLIEDRVSRAEELIDIKATALSKKLTDAANTIYRAEKLVEYAENSKELLSADTEYVFLGGDSAHSVSAEFIVDDKLTDYSTNTVQSKAIFSAIKESENKLSAEAEEKINSSVAEAIKTAVTQAVAEAKLTAHPAGSLYWSSEPTDPAELFGGSWERIKDKFILAAGDSFAAGTTGGETEVTLTEEQIPSHKHQGLYWLGNTDNNISLNQSADYGSYSGYALAWERNVAENFPVIHTGETGSGQPHNNMPPYETYYCWKRRA